MLKLFCYVRGDPSQCIFAVDVSEDETVIEIRKAIKEAKRPDFDDITADSLLLWKVSVEHSQNFKDIVEALDLGQPLQPFDILSNISWPGLGEKKVNVIIERPQSDQRPSKRARVLNNSQSQLLRTPNPSSNRTYVGPNPPNPLADSPPRLSKADMQASIIRAFKPFKQFVEDLATGKLDGYLDSVNQDDKVKFPGLILSTDLHLLLHDLGNYTDQARVESLFRSGTTQLLEHSGAGKTRKLLEGLCYHWGFYISCSTKSKGPVSGSHDFETAVKILQSMSTWNQKDSNRIQNNQNAAKRVFAMLLYARVFVLEKFVQHLRLPAGDQTREDVKPEMAARRRWVLLQAMPPCLRDSNSNSNDCDIFVMLFRSLRNADTDIMISLINKTLLELPSQRQDLFPLPLPDDARIYFAVIDEAQEAADELNECFRSNNESNNLRPILRELYDFFHSSSRVKGIILSGTGLSTQIVKESVNSIAMKDTGHHPFGIRIFSDTGRFLPGEQFHREYVCRYLHNLRLSDNSTISDRRLLERILYWFRGRHRFTASLIEILLKLEGLKLENPPRHSVLSALVKRTTSFSLTDAIDLEEKEDPIPPEVEDKINQYGWISSADNIVKDSSKRELIQCLINVVMRWTIGGQTTTLPIENQMHDIIGFGIGHLAMSKPEFFVEGANYPVYIDEPLIILYLRCFFERKTWLTNSLSFALNKSSIGFIFEELVLMVLVENFGGKFTVLSDIFNFHHNSSLKSRKVQLVSLRRDADGGMQYCSVSWGSGSSDRIGFKAENPADVLKFLEDPCGKTALFPDVNCGPDLICMFQDEETKELFAASCQMKAQELKIGTWLKALDSVTLENIYTVTKKDGKRVKYAPGPHRCLSEQVWMCFEEILGDDVYKPVIDAYHRKLRSATTASESQEPSSGLRKTPTFLRIVAAASPDDSNQEARLAAELKPTAILKWSASAVKQYIGSMADLISTTKPKSVY